MEQRKLLIIDNCIAGGKTTLINALKKRHLDWFTIEEGVPLDSKTDILALDKVSKEVSMSLFQDLVASNIYNAYNWFIKRSSDKIAIADRIWTSSKYYTQFLKGEQRPLQTFLSTIVHDALKENNIKVYYVYLAGSVDELLNHIHMRNRSCEEWYTRLNLKKLIEIYQPFSDLEGLDYKIKTCQIGDEFYNNEVEIIEAFLNT